MVKTGLPELHSLAEGYHSKRCLGCRWVEFREEVLKLKNGREVLFSGRVDNADVPWITNRIKSVVEVCHSIHSMPSFDKSHSLKSSCWSCFLLSTFS